MVVIPKTIHPLATFYERQKGTFFLGVSLTSPQPGRAERPEGLSPLLGYRPCMANDTGSPALSCPSTSSAQQVSYVRFCGVM
jgi:hypothetical protein